MCIEILSYRTHFVKVVYLLSPLHFCEKEITVTKVPHFLRSGPYTSTLVAVLIQGQPHKFIWPVF